MEGCGWKFKDGTIVTIVESTYIESRDNFDYIVRTEDEECVTHALFSGYSSVYDYLKSKGDSKDVLVSTTSSGWETENFT